MMLVVIVIVITLTTMTAVDVITIIIVLLPPAWFSLFLYQQLSQPQSLCLIGWVLLTPRSPLLLPVLSYCQLCAPVFCFHKQADCKPELTSRNNGLMDLPAAAPNPRNERK